MYKYIYVYIYIYIKIYTMYVSVWKKGRHRKIQHNFPDLQNHFHFSYVFTKDGESLAIESSNQTPTPVRINHHHHNKRTYLNSVQVKTSNVHDSMHPSSLITNLPRRPRQPNGNNQAFEN